MIWRNSYIYIWKYSLLICIEFYDLFIRITIYDIYYNWYVLLSEAEFTLSKEDERGNKINLSPGVPTFNNRLVPADCEFRSPCYALCTYHRRVIKYKLSSCLQNCKPCFTLFIPPEVSEAFSIVLTKYLPFN